ncbi:ACT domain-containing protein [Helicostylum pulchrum]|uniref:CASTOR ACT domain-containing protein n=1 Tax=Helicostylum pulchrum TaxID=562976 RepID=A0ABP9Y8I3_9FUNG|nr:ACT domain-containing protein [Helicostylum pulchrum]
MSNIQLKFLPDGFSVYQYDRSFQISSDILNAPWYTVSKTSSELSIILPSEYKLPNPQPNKSEDGWRMFQVDAQMDFGLVGILARIVSPLKDQNIPVFVVSTFDTDYVMVKEDKLTGAIKVLNGEPNMVVKPGESVMI